MMNKNIKEEKNMTNNVIVYKDVKRKTFDEVADLCMNIPEHDNPYFGSVMVHYEGTHLRGNMIVEICPGESKIYKETLQKMTEILSNY